MSDTSLVLLLADAVLALHLTFVAFVVLGLVAILLGKPLRWSWVRNVWFRVAHLVAIAVVVGQAWFGIVCPLTKVEMALRARAGDAVYSGTFVSHWLEELLYYDAPAWVFVTGYTVFGLLVAASWLWVPPRGRVPVGGERG
jgi:energy-converting hydrogenase Eha subunit A